MRTCVTQGLDHHVNDVVLQRAADVSGVVQSGTAAVVGCLQIAG